MSENTTTNDGYAPGSSADLPAVSSTTPPDHSKGVVKREPVNDFSAQIADLVAEAGNIKITDQERAVLYAPVDPAKVEIRPDGLIYLPWMEYVTRLREAFGLQWAIIPHGMPKMAGKTFIVWPFWLKVKGAYAGYAIGEQEYHPDNPKMTYGDACEGAKSNALMRLCKGLGISLELWNPAFIRDWVGKYAESFQNERGKKEWRKKVVPVEEKQDTPLVAENKPNGKKKKSSPAKTSGTETKQPDAPAGQQEEKKNSSPPGPTTAALKRSINGMMKEAGIKDQDRRKHFYEWVTDGDESVPRLEKFIQRFDDILAEYKKYIDKGEI